jgi:hypothetical protein
MILIVCEGYNPRTRYAGSFRALNKGMYPETNTLPKQHTPSLQGGVVDFSTGNNIFYGYVKIVDDINNVDIEAIKAEVANFETLIYPDGYFEVAMNGGGCPCCN